MIANPTVGQRVRIDLAPPIPGVHRHAPYRLHGKNGTVQIVNTQESEIKSHGVIIDGILWAIPAVYLRKIEGSIEPVKTNA